MKLLGAILAGGQSRRFGSDKAAAMLEGRALIDHVADALRAQCDALVVCGREYGGVTSLPDRPRPDLGPLGGLCAALRYGLDQGFDAVLSAPCDVPDLPSGLGERLGRKGGAAFVSTLPVVGFWPCELAPGLDAHLRHADDRSMRAWARVADARSVVLPIAPSNINTPEDLDARRHPKE